MDGKENVLFTNRIHIVGKICSCFGFNYSAFGKNYYNVLIQVPRLSGNVDVIPVKMPENLLMELQDSIHGCSIGTGIEIVGELSSYNEASGEGSRMKVRLVVFAKEASILADTRIGRNETYLDGFLCKPPTYRITPLGREITDVILAVNRKNGKSDYIPCIFWNCNARLISSRETGGRITILGRFQSREYEKKLSDSAGFQTLTAYEVSVMKIIA